MGTRLPSPGSGPILGSMSGSPETPRGRLKFVGLELDPSPGGKSTVSVSMEWQGLEIQGKATGIDTREGDLRMGAEASLDTIHSLTGDVVKAELRGVKAVRAFDAWVVIVSVWAQFDDRDYRLLGAKACADEGELTRGAAIAVLDALNRVLEKAVG